MRNAARNDRERGQQARGGHNKQELNAGQPSAKKPAALKGYFPPHGALGATRQKFKTIKPATAT